MATPTCPVAINFADEKELAQLPNVDPGIAQAIVNFRNTVGNVTPENIRDIPWLRVTRHLMACIVFMENADHDIVNNGNLGYCGTNRRRRTMHNQPLPNADGRSPPPYWSGNIYPQVHSTEVYADDSESSDELEDLYVPPIGRQHQYSTRGKPKPAALPNGFEFDGESNWSLFKRNFLRYASVANWTPREKRDALCWALTGKAGEFYSMLCEVGEAPSYKRLLSQLDKRFKGDELPETLQARFRNAKQEDDEDLLDWADRIQMLAAKAFKGMHEPCVRRNAVLQFCLGCSNAEAGKHASLQKPQTIESAIEAIEWFNAVTSTFPRRKAPQQPKYRPQTYQTSLGMKKDNGDSMDKGYSRDRQSGQDGAGQSPREGEVSETLADSLKSMAASIESMATSVKTMSEKLSSLNIKFDSLMDMTDSEVEGRDKKVHFREDLNEYGSGMEANSSPEKKQA